MQQAFKENHERRHDAAKPPALERTVSNPGASKPPVVTPATAKELKQTGKVEVSTLPERKPVTSKSTKTREEVYYDDNVVVAPRTREEVFYDDNVVVPPRVDDKPTKQAGDSEKKKTTAETDRKAVTSLGTEPNEMGMYVTKINVSEYSEYRDVMETNKKEAASQSASPPDFVAPPRRKRSLQNGSLDRGSRERFKQLNHVTEDVIYSEVNTTGSLRVTSNTAGQFKAKLKRNPSAPVARTKKLQRTPFLVDSENLIPERPNTKVYKASHSTNMPSSSRPVSSRPTSSRPASNIYEEIENFAAKSDAETESVSSASTASLSSYSLQGSTPKGSPPNSPSPDQRPRNPTPNQASAAPMLRKPSEEEFVPELRTSQGARGKSSRLDSVQSGQINEALAILDDALEGDLALSGKKWPQMQNLADT